LLRALSAYSSGVAAAPPTFSGPRRLLANSSAGSRPRVCPGDCAASDAVTPIDSADMDDGLPEDPRPMTAGSMVPPKK
jgi:hypothetical protein